MKIMTIGCATQDIYINYQSQTQDLQTTINGHTFMLLEEGKKHEVDHVAYYTGGGATNSAVSFSRLGFDVSTFFKIGTDSQGAFILQELANYKLDLSLVAQATDHATPVSFIIPCASGESIILAYRGTAATIHEQELPFDDIKTNDVIYITSLSGPSAALLPTISAFAKKNNVFVATNPGISQLKAGAEHLRQSLKNIDILVLNSDEATLLMTSLIATEPAVGEKIQQSPGANTKGPDLLSHPITHKNICFNLRHYFKEILSRGPRIAVVTNGPEGVYVAHENTIFFHPSVSEKIVSTVGAGDAFSSCFVAHIINGQSIETATIAGSINSASVIGHFGAKTGLLTTQALEKEIARYKKSLIKTFAL